MLKKNPPYKYLELGYLNLINCERYIDDNVHNIFIRQHAKRKSLTTDFLILIRAIHTIFNPITLFVGQQALGLGFADEVWLHTLVDNRALGQSENTRLLMIEFLLYVIPRL